MCGIFVAVKKKSSIKPEDKARFSRALSDLSFRGPDLKVEKQLTDQVYLGQTILSLTGDVTRSQGEHLQSQSKKHFIAFNGEIYNYLELAKKYLNLQALKQSANSLTDTEVLVNLHDQMKAVDVPLHLDGMYAYALYDSENKQLYLGRDPQGEKTLYIYENSELILISSEVRSFKYVVDLQIDTQVMKDYFSTRHFMFEERNLYQGVRQLLPGQIESLDLKSFQWGKVSRLELSHFIDPDLYQKNSEKNLDQLADELDFLLTENIKQMIPVNRDFASVVSGGIDSSLLSSYAMKLGRPKTLVAVNHVGKEQISHDLKKFEAKLDKKIDVLNVDKVVYSQALIHCQQVLSAPVYSHSFVGQSIQSQHVRGEGCIAMFGGEGADELFGGYSAYLNLENRNVNAKQSPSPYTNFAKTTKFDHHHDQLIEEELAKTWTHSLKLFSHVNDPSEKAAQAMMYADLSYQLPAVGLRGADQMSMMWSVETRSVFLRRDLVKFGLNLPMKFKSDVQEKNPNFTSKKILKKVFVKHFGEELILPKQGFSGFPNESGIYLGAVENYATLGVLNYRGQASDLQNETREFKWKLINLEYFLRNQGGFKC